MKPSEYQLSDFVRDPSFCNWVHKASQEDLLYWDIWLVNHPEKAPLVEEAAMLVRGIQFHRQPLPSEEVNEEWKSLRLKLQQDSQVKPRSAVTGFFRNYRLVAAVFAGLLMAGAAFWYLTNIAGYQTHHTAYGQTATVVLPDSSVVILNGNTTLRYDRNWNLLQDREVWLEGEAFFSVVHTRSEQRFMVHIPDEVIVEVLGTEFNVSSRESGNRVVLSSGQVRLNLPDEAGRSPAAGQQAYVLMQPGEMVQFRDHPSDYTKKTVNPEIYSSWKDDRFIFDDTTIREIALMLEENYGYRVQIADPALANRKLTGEIETEDPNTLLAALATSFGIQIIKNNNTVKLHFPEPE